MPTQGSVLGYCSSFSPCSGSASGHRRGGRSASHARQDVVCPLVLARSGRAPLQRGWLSQRTSKLHVTNEQGGPAAAVGASQAVTLLNDAPEGPHGRRRGRRGNSDDEAELPNTVLDGPPSQQQRQQQSQGSTTGYAAGLDDMASLLDDPDLLFYDLEDRRQSNTLASTSSPSSSPSSAPRSTNGNPTGTSTTGRPASPLPPSPPAWPQQPTLWPARPASAPSPPPAATVPPEAAQLYVGSSVANNLSSTEANSDVLLTQLDKVQLDPVVGPVSSSGVARVYVAVPTASAGAGAGTGAPIAPQAVKRRRAEQRVLDASELLLARDEAVRTELLGRTWKDLLQFDVRLGQGQGQGQQQGAASSDVPPLEEVLGMLHVEAERARHQGVQPSAQVEEDGQEAQSAGGVDARVQQQQLLETIRRPQNWRMLWQYYSQFRSTYTGAHLAATLGGLAKFWNLKGAVYKSERMSFWAVWDAVLDQTVFTAPDLTGRQAVEAVLAVLDMPLLTNDRVLVHLRALQRILSYSQMAVIPAAALSASGAGAAGGAAANAGAAAVVVSANPSARSAPAAASATQQQQQPAAPPPLSGWLYARLCYALGKMNVRVRPYRLSLRVPMSYMRGLLLGTYARLGELRPHDFAIALYGLACMRVAPPPPWLMAFYYVSARHLPQMSDKELTMILYGACRMDSAKPPPQWLEAHLTVFGRRFQEMDGAGLAVVLHALGRLKYKPRPAWLEGAIAAAGHAMAGKRVAAGEMSQLVRGLGFLGAQPDQQWLRVMWQASGEAMERGDFSAAQLADLAWGLGLMKVAVPRRWYEQLTEKMRASHRQLRPYHRRRLLAALHAFGCRRKELQQWYELMGIPLEEMPGYSEIKAQLVRKKIQQAKAQLLAEKQKKEAEAAAEAAGEGQKGKGKAGGAKAGGKKGKGKTAGVEKGEGTQGMEKGVRKSVEGGRPGRGKKAAEGEEGADEGAAGAQGPHEVKKKGGRRAANAGTEAAGGVEA